MTGPSDPFDSDGFPEVVPAGPASTQLPAEPEPPAYDTGSDAWWRARRAAAEQQEAAAAGEPTALDAGSPATPLDGGAMATPLDPGSPATPLDPGWMPEDLPAVPPAVPADPVVDAGPEPIWAPEPEPTAAVAAPDIAGTADTSGTSASSGTADTSYADDLARERPAPPATPLRPRQAVAGAAVAVLGVGLAVGALFVLNHHDDTGSPAVLNPPPVITTNAPSATPRASTSATPSAAATGRATAAPPPSTRPTAAAPVPAAPAVAPVLPVSVLNNSKISGLAKQAAADFRGGGWPVPVEGNYRGGTIATTTVYYAPGQKPSAMRFARQFGIPRVAPRFPGLPTKGMTVVVTRNYRAA